MITDACVPISRLAECLEKTKEDIVKFNLVAPIIGHVGDGMRDGEFRTTLSNTILFIFCHSHNDL
jgi:D-lactate dehydrogenase (cytochrome)